ncbi:N-acetylmuramoyl-L-alanine amidase [Salirhabdus salicampi]|uniref:N-acetylmuramoyl-L-alanine amidase n=1 Tax=Salirhabdus salicampi TaxID=476102 RepID=UPI0020C558B5|nr:N-acetylmuramoyl-L-alanine amidase [Salirhabdus salicampi]MCP8617952.1 N-acetylmuramoyl-L-alanine amidase [Salirhabdus salicampi]
MAKVKLAFIDGGHGMDTPGKRTPFISSLGRRIKENEFNSAVARKIYDHLKPTEIEAFLTAPQEHDVPLKDRTDFANNKLKEFQDEHGEDEVEAVFVSVHYDAYDGDFDDPSPSGHSIFVYPGHKNKEAGELANAIAEYLKQGTEQKWRGIREANFHVLRETEMPAVLTENGFMDNKDEALLMIDNDFQEEVAMEHAQGIADYFEVELKSETKVKSAQAKRSTGETYYRVVTGSFKNLENAERRVEKLKEAGFDSFITPYKN